MTDKRHQTQLQRVAQYYKENWIHYFLLWTYPGSYAMHFGYYDTPHTSHHAAVLRMNEKLAELVGVGPTDRVLDAGCGIGGTSFWLASHIGCDVTGISIAPNQIDEAEKIVKRIHLEKNVHFFIMDYAHTAFGNKQFDVIWGQESICHADDKEQVIKEAFRLLRPGGRLMICDYMLRNFPPLNLTEQEEIHDWLEGWVMPSLPTPSTYESLMKYAGFSSVQSTDITDYTLPSLKRIEFMSIVLYPIVRLLHFLRIFNDVHLWNIKASRAQMRAFHHGLWRFHVLVAEKKK